MRWLARTGRRYALRASALLNTSSLFRRRGEPTVGALLFHRFFEPGEPRSLGIERLRRQLAWLRANYTPISLDRFLDGVATGNLPERSVLVTADDALTDLLHVAGEFSSFGVPLSVFICAGWTASASKGVGFDLVARAASAIQWHEGQDLTIRVGSGRSYSLSGTLKAKNIDHLIEARDELLPDLEELCTRVESLVAEPRQCCTWSELRDLAAAGVAMGAHSVTHVWMSQASPIRRRFEIAESKRLCEELLGPCRAFAYPFGMAETHSARTREELERAGYDAAFLTHSDFINARSDLLTLPRLSMPDEAMPDAEFRARASGAGILIRRLKSAVWPTGRDNAVAGQ